MRCMKRKSSTANPSLRLAATLLAPAVPALALSMVLYNPDDAFLNQYSDGGSFPLREHNFGATVCGPCGGTVVRADYSAVAVSSDSVKRPLMRFDLTQLPANVEITGAELWLRVSHNPGAGPDSNNQVVYFFHEVLESWVEGTQTALNGGHQPGAVSWDARMEGAALGSPVGEVPWATPGGTFAATAFAGAGPFAVHGGGGVFSFDFAPGGTGNGVQVLQNWYDSPADNHGFTILIWLAGSNTDDRDLETAWYSSEATGIPDAARPQLEIFFDIVDPPPQTNFTTGVVLDWPSVAGETFAVLQSTNLLGEAFEVIDGDVPATPPLNSYTVGIDNVSSAAFRVDID